MFPMKNLYLAATASALVCLLALGTATPGFAAGHEKKPSGEIANVQELTATVEKIDHSTRMVTLKGPDGNMVTFRASDEAKNLDQVNAGDFVNVKYYEAVAWQVMKPGSSPKGMSETSAVERAKKGEKPGGVAGRQVTIVADIEAIDKDGKHVTLKGPRGNSERVAVRNPKNLENVKVGDQVQITYTEGFAISVEKASPKGKK
jgi:Cu/Ag efflux protein CusF